MFLCVPVPVSRSLIHTHSFSRAYFLASPKLNWTNSHTWCCNASRIFRNVCVCVCVWGGNPCSATHWQTIVFDTKSDLTLCQVSYTRMLLSACCTRQKKNTFQFKAAYIIFSICLWQQTNPSFHSLMSQNWFWWKSKCESSAAMLQVLGICFQSVTVD